MTTSTYPNDWCVTQKTQGGKGGTAFNAYVNPVSTVINGQSVDLYYVISKIECWIADHRMVGIRVYFSNSNAGYDDDNTSQFFGKTNGTYSSFTFDLGERLTSLNIYKAEYNSNDYCGGLDFTTSMGRSYSAKSGNSKSVTSMDIGYGAAVGIFGNSGEAIDRLGFWMILPADDMQLKDVVYDGSPSAPELAQVYSYPYVNDSNVPSSESYSATQEVVTTQSWTLTTTDTVSAGFTVSVSADVYGIEASAEATASWEETSETVDSLEYSTSSTQTFSLGFEVPAHTTMVLDVYYYSGSYELAYTGLGMVKTNSGKPFNYYLSGKTTGNSSTELYSRLYTA